MNTLTITILVLALGFVYIPSLNSPEHQEHVAVAEKRIYKNDEGYLAYFITFKFSDDSIKEFNEGRDGVSHRKRGIIYGSLHVGENGILIYKENMRFIRFEKDLEFGGEILESYQISEKQQLLHYSVLPSLYWF